MKTKDAFAASIVVAMLLAVPASTQNTNPSKPTPKITPQQTAGNPAKLPPAAAAEFPVPKLELTRSQNPESSSGTFTNFQLRIINRAQFPEGLFLPESNLPPNPCKLPKTTERLWVTVYAKDGSRKACGSVKSRRELEAVSIRLRTSELCVCDLKGKISEVYVVLTDIKTGTSHKSTLLSTNAK
jgi:hypothetical protein